MNNSLPFVFNDFENVENSNSVIWESCKKSITKDYEGEFDAHSI